MKPKILITCPTSKIGIATVEELASRHASALSELRVGTHNIPSTSKVLRAFPSVHVVELDPQSPDTVQSAVKDIDRLLLICPPPSSSFPSGMDFSDWAKVVVEHADLAGVKFFVLVTFLSDAHTPLEPQFQRIRNLMTDLKVNWCELRSALLYETVLDQNLNEIREHAKFFGCSAEDSKLAVPMVAARDVAVAAAKALLHTGAEKEKFHGKTFRLTGEVMTPQLLTAQTSQVVNRSLQYQQFTPAQQKAKKGLRSFLMPELVELWEKGTAEVREELKQLPPETENLKALGVRPTTFLQFVHSQKPRLAPVA